MMMGDNENMEMMNGGGQAPQGLSAQLAGGNSGGQPQQSQEELDTINEIKDLLMQGMKPEDLVAKGVPEELVQEAMEELAEESNEVEGGDKSGLSGMLA